MFLRYKGRAAGGNAINQLQRSLKTATGQNQEDLISEIDKVVHNPLAIAKKIDLVQGKVRYFIGHIYSVQ